jgi:hypothetical protein
MLLQQMLLLFIVLFLKNTGSLWAYFIERLHLSVTMAQFLLVWINEPLLSCTRTAPVHVGLAYDGDRNK